MTSAPDELLVAFELHSEERIVAALDAGYDVRAPIRGVRAARRQAVPCAEGTSIPRAGRGRSGIVSPVSALRPQLLPRRHAAL